MLFGRYALTSLQYTLTEIATVSNTCRKDIKKLGSRVLKGAPLHWYS